MRPAMRQSSIAELFRSLVGASTGIRRVRDQIARVAPLGATVMLLGQTGTGKEVAARNIHFLSGRRNMPFVAIDCSTLQRFDRLPTEKLEQARGGTLFLDEVGDIGPELQRTLSQVLQEQSEDETVRSIGNEADIRVVAGTHRDLQAMTAEGQFSEHLYARLSVVRILLPPLRERREDIPLLISEIGARLAACGYLPDRVSDQALRALLAYDWPGNVRELAGLIEGCVIRAGRKEIQLEDLPGRIRGANESAISEIPTPERLIRQALAESGGAVPLAASRLGLREASLVASLRSFGIGLAQKAPPGV